MGTARDSLTFTVIGAAIEVHRHLGPGLLESTYRACLAHELGERSIQVAAEVPLPIVYKGVALDCGYRMDLVVEDRLILELKVAQNLNPLYEAQILSYLKLSGIPTGLLINFGQVRLKDGVKRLVV